MNTVTKLQSTYALLASCQSERSNRFETLIYVSLIATASLAIAQLLALI